MPFPDCRPAVSLNKDVVDTLIKMCNISAFCFDIGFVWPGTEERYKEGLTTKG